MRVIAGAETFLVACRSVQCGEVPAAGTAEWCSLPSGLFWTRHGRGGAPLRWPGPSVRPGGGRRLAPARRRLRRLGRDGSGTQLLSYIEQVSLPLYASDS